MDEVISPSVPPTPLIPTMVQQLKALGKYVDIVMNPIPVVDDATFIEYVYEVLKEYTAANKGKSMPIKTIHSIYKKLNNGCASKKDRDILYRLLLDIWKEEKKKNLLRQQGLVFLVRSSVSYTHLTLPTTPYV